MTDLFMTGATADEVWPLVRDFHYSRRMPSAIQHCFAWRQSGGLFGDFGDPQAAVIYGNPVNRAFPTDCLELQRLVRRDVFAERLSAFVSWSLRWLREHTAVPFVLSYADSGQGHHGGIYQATGFHYVHNTGRYQDGLIVKDTGEFIHGRQCNRMFGSRSLETIRGLGDHVEAAYFEPKFLYVFPLRQRLGSILRQRRWQSMPYPKPSRDPSIGRPAPSGVSCEHTAGVAP